MDFDPSAEYLEVIAVAESVAAKLRPGYIERERAGQYPWRPLAMLGSAGLLGLNVPEAAGGQDAGELLTGMVCEILATADYALPLLVMEAGSAAKLIHRHGSEQLREQWLPDLLAGRVTVGLALTEPEAGSDIAAATNTHARPSQHGDGWILNGEKCSMTFVESQLALVLAGTPDGPALFAVPTDAPGVSVSPFEDMGASQIGRAVVTFDDVRVPASSLMGAVGKGVGTVISVLGIAKIHVSAITLGLAKASLEDAIQWAQERRTYGALLATRQGVMFPLADMATEVEAARLLIHKALWLADKGRPYQREAAMVKAWVPAMAARICHESLLTLGHVGYSREHPAQARLRDVIGAELGEGAANVQRLITTRSLTGLIPT
ncbi:MAG TPA: acyl-CoA dehydrogenase family protein [Pseudonocardia sp.]|nr:acyl-CoA dehydrogenase family protein [Pseudonocardia sp.]